jgi:uncharacterized repeat protein (TIGR03803 family)
VNLILASRWTTHPDHLAAKAWIDSADKFYTTAIVELGFVRISLSGAYRASWDETQETLKKLHGRPGYQFLVDDADGTAAPETGSKDTTDAHLVTLARRHGLSPLGALIEGRDGVLYGMSYSGGSSGVGAIFKLDQAGTNYGVWRGFLSSGGDGQNPRGGLVLGRDGAFYGTTWNGGQSGVGTVFQIYPPETPQMLGTVMTGTTAQVWFSGVSGYQYQVLRSTNLVNWAGLGTVPMPVSGVCTNVDPAAPLAGAFYRAAWVP